jgi:VanZ family protein
LRSFARYWLPPLAWMALIWSVSSDIGSSEHSAGTFAWILTLLFPWATAGQVEVAHLAIRKCGHMVEYAILAALWFRAHRAGRRLSFTASARWALGISVGWAIVDEVHQSFVPSRTASALDVLLDAAGASLVLLALRLRVLRLSGPRAPLPRPLIVPTRKTSQP